MSRAASPCSIEISENSSIVVICACARSLPEIRQLRSREPKPYRARGSRLPIDESVCLERLDHVMNGRRRDAKEPLKI